METEIQIQEQRISFKTAVLLKAKGFNQLVDTHYCYGSGDKEEPNTGEIFVGGFWDNITGHQRHYRNSELSNWDLPYGEFSSPTQAFVQTWLREVHKIEIAVQWFDNCYIKSVKQKPFKANTYRVEGFAKYEEILELAFVEGLNLIRK